jgi:hypothetical protein
MAWVYREVIKGKELPEGTSNIFSSATIVSRLYEFFVGHAVFLWNDSFISQLYIVDESSELVLFEQLLHHAVNRLDGHACMCHFLYLVSEGIDALSLVRRVSSCGFPMTAASARVGCEACAL